MSDNIVYTEEEIWIKYKELGLDGVLMLGNEKTPRLGDMTISEIDLLINRIEKNSRRTKHVLIRILNDTKNTLRINKIQKLKNRIDVINNIQEKKTII